MAVLRLQARVSCLCSIIEFEARLSVWIVLEHILRPSNRDVSIVARVRRAPPERAHLWLVSSAVLRSVAVERRCARRDVGARVGGVGSGPVGNVAATQVQTKGTRKTSSDVSKQEERGAQLSVLVDQSAGGRCQLSHSSCSCHSVAPTGNGCGACVHIPVPPRHSCTGTAGRAAGWCGASVRSAPHCPRRRPARCRDRSVWEGARSGSEDRDCSTRSAAPEPQQCKQNAKRIKPSVSAATIIHRFTPGSHASRMRRSAVTMIHTDYRPVCSAA